jgi:hypothetical protein
MSNKTVIKKTVKNGNDWQSYYHMIAGKHSELLQKIGDQFDQHELKMITRLCHPDKHNGSKSSHDIFVKTMSLLNKET